MNEIPDTDLVRLAEREVIEKAKTWYAIWRIADNGSARQTDRVTAAACDVLAAVSLLESREKS